MLCQQNLQGNFVKYCIFCPSNLIGILLSFIISMMQARTNDNSSAANVKKIYNEDIVHVGKEQLKNILHRSIGAITFLTKQKKVGVGSAFLISADLVLTAAHNLYDKDQCYEYDELKFYIEKEGVGNKYYKAEGVRYLDEFKKCQSQVRLQFDYALIKLKQVLSYDEFLQISIPCQICTMKRKEQICLEIFGYPYHEENYKPLDKYGEKLTLCQYGLTKKSRLAFIDHQICKIGYEISTYGGQSGCPVVADGKIIALHNGSGLSNEQFNVGRLVTPDLIRNLEKWCLELHGNSFQKNDEDLCAHLKNRYTEKKPPLKEKDLQFLQVKITI